MQWSGGRTHELAMDIATNSHRTPYGLDIRLLHQDLPGLEGEKRKERGREKGEERISPSFAWGGGMKEIRTLSQRVFTSASESCLHWLSWAIQESTSCSILRR